MIPNTAAVNLETPHTNPHSNSLHLTKLSFRKAVSPVSLLLEHTLLFISNMIAEKNTLIGIEVHWEHAQVCAFVEILHESTTGYTVLLHGARG